MIQIPVVEGIASYICCMQSTVSQVRGKIIEMRVSSRSVGYFSSSRSGNSFKRSFFSGYFEREQRSIRILVLRQSVSMKSMLYDWSN